MSQLRIHFLLLSNSKGLSGDSILLILFHVDGLALISLAVEHVSVQLGSLFHHVTSLTEVAPRLVLLRHGQVDARHFDLLLVNGVHLGARRGIMLLSGLGWI